MTALNFPSSPALLQTYGDSYVYDGEKWIIIRSRTLASAEAGAFLARTTGLDATHTDAYIALIDGLVADGIWSKLDALYTPGTKDSTTALLNLVSSNYNLTQISTPVQFAAAQGFTTYTAGALFSTNFNPTTAVSPKYTQNSAHLGVWNLSNTVLTQPNGAIGSMGASANVAIIWPQYTDGNAYFRTNMANAGANITNSTNAAGHYVGNRSGASAWQGYKNGSLITSGTDTSVVNFNGAFYLLGYNSNGTANAASYETPAAHFGSSLTAGEVTSIYTRLKTFQDAVAVGRLVIDGQGSNIFTSTLTGTVTLTTTRSNDIIVLMTYAHAASGTLSVSTVTSPTLTWTKRKAYGYFTNDPMEIWWAVASSPLSGEVVTVVHTGGTVDAGTLFAFGVSGSPNLSAPWDTHASLVPCGASASGVGPTASITGVYTSATRTMIVGFTVTNNNNQAAIPTQTQRIRVQTRNNNGSAWAVNENFLQHNTAALSNATYDSNNGGMYIGGAGITLDALVAP